MISILLLISFCLLVSFCLFESLFLSRLMKRLKWHRKYIIEFLSIRNNKGMSVEQYLLTSLFPKYMSFLLFLFFTVTLINILPFFSSIFKIIISSFGLIATLWTRYYNRSFFNLLWDKVLSKVE